MKTNNKDTNIKFPELFVAMLNGKDYMFIEDFYSTLSNLSQVVKDDIVVNEVIGKVVIYKLTPVRTIENKGFVETDL